MMLGNIAAETDPTDPTLSRTMLMAQALNQEWMDSQHAEKVWEKGNLAAQQIAQAHNWTPQELTAAQDMLSLAMTRTAKERGVTTFGYTVGPGMSIEPAVTVSVP